ncbi:ParB family protein [Calothrix sp. PCC 7716]|nr:ParB family protein [Calothrix sp. PCC 7716]
MKTKKELPYTSQLKGVAALLSNQSGAYDDEVSEIKTNSIPISLINLPPSQPRHYFDEQKLYELARSIEKFGVLEPLLVRPLANNRYELISGERRLRASKIAELTEVPVNILDLDDYTTAQVRLVENLQREDLNPVEEASAIISLLAIQLHKQESEITSHFYKMRNACDRGDDSQKENVFSQPESIAIQELFKTIGRLTWESFIKVRLPLLNLPDDVLKILSNGKLEYTKALAISRIKDPEQRALLLEKAVAEDLSLSAIKNLIRELSAPATSNNETATLKERYKTLSSQFLKAKLWDNPKKRKQLEKMLATIETMLNED